MLLKHRFTNPALRPGKEGMFWLAGMTVDARFIC